MRLLFIALALCVLPGVAAAGAWPRELGQWFASVTHKYADERGRAGSAQAGYSTLYIERGMPGRRTIGLDLGRGDTYGDWSALAFLRVPLDTGAGANRFAAEIGLGGGGGEGAGTHVLIRPGLSWGRGLRKGWAALDGFLEYRPDKGTGIWKLDATLGLKPSARSMMILQLQSGDYPGAKPFTRLAPSYVRQVGRGNQFVEIGLTYGLSRDRQAGIKLGSWMSF